MIANTIATEMSAQSAMSLVMFMLPPGRAGNLTQ